MEHLIVYSPEEEVHKQNHINQSLKTNALNLTFQIEINTITQKVITSIPYLPSINKNAYQELEQIEFSQKTEFSHPCINQIPSASKFLHLKLLQNTPDPLFVESDTAKYDNWSANKITTKSFVESTWSNKIPIRHENSPCSELMVPKNPLLSNNFALYQENIFVTSLKVIG